MVHITIKEKDKNNTKNSMIYPDNTCFLESFIRGLKKCSVDNNTASLEKDEVTLFNTFKDDFISPFKFNNWNNISGLLYDYLGDDYLEIIEKVCLSNLDIMNFEEFKIFKEFETYKQKEEKKALKKWIEIINNKIKITK